LREGILNAILPGRFPESIRTYVLLSVFGHHGYVIAWYSGRAQVSVSPAVIEDFSTSRDYADLVIGIARLVRASTVRVKGITSRALAAACVVGGGLLYR
jgi:hypothetical protein